MLKVWYKKFGRDARRWKEFDIMHFLKYCFAKCFIKCTQYSCSVLVSLAPIGGMTFLCKTWLKQFSPFRRYLNSQHQQIDFVHCFSSLEQCQVHYQYQNFQLIWKLIQNIWKQGKILTNEIWFFFGPLSEPLFNSKIN